MWFGTGAPTVGSCEPLSREPESLAVRVSLDRDAGSLAYFWGFAMLFADFEELSTRL